ncbi:MAG: DUF559 domain-containing protein [Nocardioides sp.]
MTNPPLPDHPFLGRAAGHYGLTPKALRLALGQGAVMRLFTGVYARADLVDSTELRADAARLVMSPYSVLCDRSAAWLHGIGTFRYAELDFVPPLETYVLRGHDPTDRRDCHGGSRDLLPEDWQTLAGVRVTTPLRTALDLACTLSRREALAAMDAFAREFGFGTAELQRLLRRYRRRRGVVQARELVQLVDACAESRGESWVRLEIHDNGLPAPELQVWVVIVGVPTYRLDLAYRRARVAVEYDGEEFHTSPEQRQRDQRRRKWLRSHGWYVIVVTKESFTGDALVSWISELRSVLKERGANIPS